MGTQEFVIERQRQYDRSSPIRWLVSHVAQYPYLPLALVVCSVLSNTLLSYTSILIGQAFAWITSPQPALRDLVRIVTLVALARLAQGALQLGRNASTEVLAQRLERDSRDELYVSLLGKSLTFHGRQRVGDLMARATNDVRQVNLLSNPGLNMVFDSAVGILVPIITIATIRIELLITPLLFVVLLAITLRDYNRKLTPVSDAMRQQFGVMNAGLAESISGIEVVKASAQETQEQDKFAREAAKFRNLFVRQGEIQARYLPFLVYSAAFAAAFMHALLLYQRDASFGIGDIVAYMGLVTLLRFPTFISIFSFSLIQLGISSAERILSVLNAETELGENASPLGKRIEGEVVFDNVSFGYDEGAPVLKNISFRAAPGETIAIVGQTGSGKSTLTKLINRVYDVRDGRVLVDGADVREWSLESLRSQISMIEQDIFLFSRTLAENIAFGVAQQASQEQIERAAREAQAHEFILSFPEGYHTEVGERGVTLSGGQRQRIAIARAFLTDPRILVLDDSTSAIDSETEDAIQRAMYRVQQGRTTFLITHRLSQIRWADRILVLRQGELVDQGTHEELIERSRIYRNLFAPYEPDGERQPAGDSETDDRHPSRGG